MITKNIPIYVATGFLESGKTSFIKEIVYDDDFTEGLRSLIICCEQGEESYDPIELNKHNSQVVYVENEEELNTEYFDKLRKIYKPKLAFLEYNGTWNTDDVYSKLPKNWPIVQIFTTINAETFDIYLANMRSIMMGHVKLSDCAIVNRCNENTNKASVRRIIRGAANRINVLFENVEGYEDDDDGTNFVPFDCDADPIVVDSEDFGILILELQDNQDKYVGKNIKVNMYAYKDQDMPKGFFYGGRHVMTCCEEDIRFLGMMTRWPDSDKVESEKFYTVTGKISIESNPMYKFPGPVITAVSVEEAPEPANRLCYFN